MKLRHRDDVTEYERKNLFYLLTISALYTLGLSMSNIFVNIFLWRQSHDIELLAVYNICIYLTQLFIFIIAGKWVKRFDRVIILRVGIILISLFFIGSLILRKSCFIRLYASGCRTRGRLWFLFVGI